MNIDVVALNHKCIHSYKPHWAAVYTWQHAAPIRHVARNNRCICQQSCAVVHTCSTPASLLQQLASNRFCEYDSLASSVARKAAFPSLPLLLGRNSSQSSGSLVLRQKYHATEVTRPIILHSPIHERAASRPSHFS